MSAQLSEALLTGTSGARAALAGSPFLAGVLHGRWGDGVYGEYVRAVRCADYLHQLRHVYAALEEGLARHAKHPVVSAVPAAHVQRTHLIDADLRRLLGELGAEAAPCPSPAAEAHARRLRQLAEGTPGLLLAHAYVLAVCESAPSDLPGGWGVRTFCPAREVAVDARACAHCPVMQRWACTLDGLGLHGEAAAALVREARLAFALREALCEELAEWCE